MVNSCSSTQTLFNVLDMLISNTANANVMMSINFMTFASFFLYLIVSTLATPLMLAPARETSPKEKLTGRPMNVLSVATLDIPEAMIRPLQQAISHVSRSKVLEYFSCSFLYLSTSLSNSCHFPWTTFRW